MFIIGITKNYEQLDNNLPMNKVEVETLGEKYGWLFQVESEEEGVAILLATRNLVTAAERFLAQCIDRRTDAERALLRAHRFQQQKQKHHDQIINEVAAKHPTF